MWQSDRMILWFSGLKNWCGRAVADECEVLDSIATKTSGYAFQTARWPICL